MISMKGNKCLADDPKVELDNSGSFESDMDVKIIRTNNKLVRDE